MCGGAGRYHDSVVGYAKRSVLPSDFMCRMMQQKRKSHCSQNNNDVAGRVGKIPIELNTGIWVTYVPPRHWMAQLFALFFAVSKQHKNLPPLHSIEEHNQLEPKTIVIILSTTAFI